MVGRVSVHQLCVEMHLNLTVKFPVIFQFKLNFKWPGIVKLFSMKFMQFSCYMHTDRRTDYLQTCKCSETAKQIFSRHERPFLQVVRQCQF